MRIFILTLSLVLALVQCQDYSCPKGKSKPKKIMLSPGDSFSFNTNYDDEAEYLPKTKCPVQYKASKKCKDGIRFSCSSFDLVNRDAKKCRKGDRLMIGKKAYCKENGPDPVTLKGKAAKKGLKVQFLSDKKLQASGAQCTAECLDGAAATTEAPTTTSGNGVGPSMNLKLASLSSFPLAKCNDGTAAVYYRQPNINDQTVKKMLIYLRGGGLCVPGSASKGCDDRCSAEPSLCTASTDPDYILTESNLGDNIGSNKQAENPAFWDYSKIYVPYCSSDLYSGTASASSETGNRIFHGKHIVKAVLDDLIANTWITQAEQVTLIGTSAGAVGVEFNCDLVAEELHKVSPGLDVKCVADSGTVNPAQALAAACGPGIGLVRDGVRLWQGQLDQSCVAASNSDNCIFLADSYTHIATPFMVMTSAADDNTLLDICALEEPIDNNFLQSWKTEMGQLGAAMSQSRSDVGIFFDNCPFHVAVVFPDAYKRHSVPTLDGGSGKKVLRDLLYNFVRQEKPYQGVDDMTTLNPQCSP